MDLMIRPVIVTTDPCHLVFDGPIPDPIVIIGAAIPAAKGIVRSYRKFVAHGISGLKFPRRFIAASENKAGR